MLAGLNRFQQTCESNGFAIDTYIVEVHFEYVRSDVPLSIRTDNGGKFITEELRVTTDQHEYIMETTSPEMPVRTAWPNGLAGL